MKRILLATLLFLISISTNYAQIKLLKGTIKSEKDSLPLDSTLVLLKDLTRSDTPPNNTLYYTTTDSNGNFIFQNIPIPVFTGDSIASSNQYLRLEILRNNYYEYSEELNLSNDTLTKIVIYLDQGTIEKVEPTLPAPKLIHSYDQYSSGVSFIGSNFDPKEPYNYNYKTGMSFSNNYRITPVNYLSIEVSPFIYKRYNLKQDSLNTKSVYKKEYFSTMQSGLGLYLRTHMISWDQKRNALFFDLGIEYNCPWYYRYINKPTTDTKLALKNFHKYNELYANARIGILKWFYIKGQYRLTDVFKAPMIELPKWSVDLQFVMIIDGTHSGLSKFRTSW